MRVLPRRFHRIRHYGLFANGARAENIARTPQLLKMAAADREPASTNTDDLLHSSVPMLWRAHDHHSRRSSAEPRLALGRRH
jgi:hypothetical protein